MKAGLPENTELAHRTGISDRNENDMRTAMNDVGIFKLPNGNHIILSVYLKNITEERSETEKIIADIARATWNFYKWKNINTVIIGKSFTTPILDTKTQISINNNLFRSIFKEVVCFHNKVYNVVLYLLFLKDKIAYLFCFFLKKSKRY